MVNSALWFASAVFLAALAGPAVFVASHIDAADAADLYVVVDAGGVPDLDAHGAREIGPRRSTVARMIHAPPAAWASLREAGYYLLPAGPFAALCGDAVLREG